MGNKDITELLAEYAQEVKDFGHVETSTSVNEILKYISSLEQDSKRLNFLIDHVLDNYGAKQEIFVRESLITFLKHPKLIDSFIEVDEKNESILNE
jgi:hypothetical protein